VRRPAPARRVGRQAGRHLRQRAGGACRQAGQGLDDRHGAGVV